MDNYCWAWCGVNDWWLSLAPEAKAGWVSAWGTVLAAAIAAWVYVGSNRRHEALRRADAAAAKTDRELRERIVLQQVLIELRSIAIRMDSAIRICINAESRDLEAVPAFVQAAFISEKTSLESLRASLMSVPPELALLVSECESEVAIFNTELRRFEATRMAEVASYARTASVNRVADFPLLMSNEFGINKEDAARLASMALTIALSTKRAATPILERVTLDESNWARIFDRCTDHSIPVPSFSTKGHSDRSN